MNFAGKYELFEAVSSGSVETFVARNASTGERVLIHIFECRDRGSDVPSLQWLLEAFRRLAPEPPGLVVEAGRYDRAAYGYLVTQLPDNTLLQNWLRAYEALNQDSKKAPTVARDPTPPGMGARSVAPLGKPAPAEANSKPDADSAGELTKAFRTLKAETGPSIDICGSPDSTHVETAAVPGGSSELTGSGVLFAEKTAPQEPGPFTKQFLAQLDEQSGKTMADSTAPEPSESARSGIPTGSLPFPSELPGKPQRTSHEAGRFTNLFPSSPAQTGTPSKFPDDASRADAAKTGEFTKFFQGPFTGEPSAEIPELSPEMPPRKGPGDFTVLFGSTKQSYTPEPPMARSPLSDSSVREETGGFTQLFSASEEAAKTSQPKEATEATGTFPAVREPVWTSPSPPPAKLPTDSPPPSPPRPADIRGPREDQSLFSPHSKPEGATRVFSTTGNEPELHLPPVQSGPSEYTRIISAASKVPVAPEEPPIAPGSPKPSASGFPEFSPPPPPAVPQPVPKIPAAPAPPSPRVAKSPAPPPVPKVAPPAMPKLSPPEPEASKPPVSYWPLILIMNGLFILAVLLVLYFALKH